MYCTLYGSILDIRNRLSVQPLAATKATVTQEVYEGIEKITILAKRIKWCLRLVQ